MKWTSAHSSLAVFFFNQTLLPSLFKLSPFLIVRDEYLIYFPLKDYETGDTFSFWAHAIKQDAYQHIMQQYMI